MKTASSKSEIFSIALLLPGGQLLYLSPPFFLFPFAFYSHEHTVAASRPDESLDHNRRQDVARACWPLVSLLLQCSAAPVPFSLSAFFFFFFVRHKPQEPTHTRLSGLWFLLPPTQASVKEHVHFTEGGKKAGRLKKEQFSIYYVLLWVFGTGAQ